MILTGRFEREIGDDAVEELRKHGYKDSAIIHLVIDELEGKITPFYLTEFGKLEFFDCEIKE